MTYKELNDESVKLLYEFTPMFERLKDAVNKNRDPYSILSSITNRLQLIDNNLLSILARRDRSFLLDYFKGMLKEEGISAHIIMPEHGVPIKLISAFAEILIAIFRKYSDRTFMIDLESNDGGFVIKTIIKDIPFEEIKNSSVVKAISTLDGILEKIDDKNSRLLLPNIFGREKFLKIYSKNGIVALPLLSIMGNEKINFKNMINKKINIELGLGTDRIKFNIEIAGLEIALRSYPKLPMKVKYFKGVILGSEGIPIPIVNIAEIFNEGVFEWLC